MKVICVNTKDYYNLTLNKWYELDLRDDDVTMTYRGGVRRSSSCYYIIDNNGNVRGIEKECFMTLEEWRDNKLSKLGI